MSQSSLKNLIELLVNECANKPQLSHLSQEVVTDIVLSLEDEIFSEDNRRSSISSLDTILDKIVDQLYLEEKK